MQCFAARSSPAAERGIESLTFEELERLDESLTPLRQKDLLKARAAHWQETLQAETI